MKLSSKAERVIGKLVLDLQFRDMVLQTPSASLTAEGLSPVEVDWLTIQLKKVTSAHADDVDEEKPTRGWAS